MKSRWYVHRRTMLRGAGALIGLPLLEAMTAPGRKAHAAGLAPVRFVGWFHPNGINDDRWTPAAEGDLQLTPTLAPLEKVRSHVLLVSGLQISTGNVGSHPGGQSAFLTATRSPKPGETTSVDQVVAAKFGPMTRFPSINVSLETDGGYAGFQDKDKNGFADSPTESFDDTKDRCFGEACRIAQSKGSLLPNFYNPRLVFERLFGAGATGGATGPVIPSDPKALARFNAYRRSVLDYANEDAKRIQARVGVADRIRLDEYLTGVREIERAIEKSEKAATMPVAQGCGPGPKPLGVPIEPIARAKLFCDMFVKAFQCDATRSATLMTGNNTSILPFLVDGVPHPHHTASHWVGYTGGRKVKDAIDLQMMGAVAYFLEQMKAIPEGGGSMLDNVVVYFSSDIADPNRHDHINMPVLIGGRGGGAFTTGRHVRAKDRQTADLFATILESAFGIPTPKFGEFGTGQLTGLRGGMR